MLLQAHEMSERGVYCARYTSKGKLILYAVDSKGDEVKRDPVEQETPARIAQMIEDLWAHLDVVDPRPQLHIVRARALPCTERAATLEMPDPYEERQPIALVRPQSH